MHWNPKEWILIGVLLALTTVTAAAQVTTTQVADTIYLADGTAATGTVLISWPAFTTSGGEAIPNGNTSIVIGTDGAFSAQLTPNAGSTPMGSYYTVVFHLSDGSVSRQYWVVPVSSTSVRISAIETTVLPASVAMQTVTKSYVDTAIAAAVSGHPLDSSPYVLITGDTMTGPLLLPGDPVSALQAADKNYVDTSVAAVSGGVGQKVSTLPTGTQIVSQPTGTQLDVNNLNGVEYASQYVNGLGGNGIANAAASPDCAGGCEIKVEQDYTNETFVTAALNNKTHVIDARGGRQVDSFLNPLDVVHHGVSAGQTIDDVSTQSAASLSQLTGNQDLAAVSLSITQEGLAGGSNLLPAQYETVPYFKMGYSALNLNGVYNTQGQHGLMPEEIDCFGVGDCLLGSRFIYASGGARDDADEGAHLYDTSVLEDSRVFEGTCLSGCTAGSTSVMFQENSGGGTQGDGRFVIDTNPAKTITSAGTGGAIIGNTPGSAQLATAQFSGTSFPLSVFLSTGQVITSQANNMAPGTVTFSIATSDVPTGFATNTAAIGSSSGLACVVDQNTYPGAKNYEMAPYSVVDSTHLQMTLNKPHQIGAAIAFGGLCGYGLEQTIDTANGIRQVFPVIGAYASTSLYYSGLGTPVIGANKQTSGYVNVTMSLGSATRTGNVVTAAYSSPVEEDLNGLTVTISGVADSSFNGTYVVTTTGPDNFTYAQSGSNSSSTGGSATVLTGGFVLYPMAEVLSVFDPATHNVDGQMTLAPNNVPWAVNDSVEQPHFYQEYITPDVEFIGQTVPRPPGAFRGGMQYQLNNTSGLTGWSIQNASPTTNYFGYGGTHAVPDAAYEALGIWKRTMSLAAGEQAVFAVHCNLHGCGNWNSGYDIFEMDFSSGIDTVHYSPPTNTLSFNLGIGSYSFTPSAFTAGTIDAETLNATTINGSLSGASITSGTIPASVLPVFGPSGSGHAPGAVPDPGATAGSTRYLREDGTWVTPSGGGGGGSGSVTITGGTIDGTVIGGTTPGPVSATQLNGLPVSEYVDIPRKPLTTLLQALHNAKNQAVNIVVLSDSFGICDYTNCVAGPTVSTNRFTEQLRINLQAQYGSHGTGMAPLVGLVGPTLNTEEWGVSGTWGTVNTLGPYQLASFVGSSLVHLSSGAVATFTSSIPYDTIDTYCMTTSSSGSIAVAIDGVSVGTACASTTSSATAHAVSSSTVSLGTHVTTFTSTGDSYIYAAEGTAGSTGVSLHNLSVGSAAAEWFGLNPSTQLAFSDLIPTGTQGVVTLLQTNEPGVGYSVSSFTSAMNAIIAHEQALSGSPSVMMVVPPQDVITGTSPYTAAQVAIAQTQNVAFVNIQDRWGTAYVSSSGLWDLGTTAPGIHPNDKGARDVYSMIYAQLVDPVPFGTVSSGTASSISGLIAAGSGVTLTGAGTSGSPYSIASTGGSGGCTANCTLTGATTLSSSGGSTIPLNVTSDNLMTAVINSTNGAGPILELKGTATGVDTWGIQSGSSADTAGGEALLIGDFSTGIYSWKSTVASSGAGYNEFPSLNVFCWSSTGSVTANVCDTGISRTSAAAFALGNGSQGDASGSLSLSSLSANLYKGPATAPSGSCTTVGWAFSQDGHATFCNGSTWTTKI